MASKAQVNGDGRGHGSVKHKAQAASPAPAAPAVAVEEKAGRWSPLFVAEQNLTVANAGAVVVAAKGDMHLEKGGGAVVVAGKDLHVLNGGGALLTAGRDAQVSNGSCLVANAGRDVTVERGTVGIVFGRNVTLGPETRVLIDLSPQKVFGVLEALVMLPVSAVLSLLPQGESKKSEVKSEK
jgi:hypothetical protein